MPGVRYYQRRAGDNAFTEASRNVPGRADYGWIMTAQLTPKQRQFNAAMEKYDQMKRYLWVGYICSFMNVSLQAVLAVLAFRQTIGPLRQALTLAAALCHY